MNITSSREGIDILALVWHASLMVQLVMLLLVVASVISWTMIIRKRRIVRQAHTAAGRFEALFWAGGNLNQMFQDYTRKDLVLNGMENIFVGGFREFARLEKQKNIEPMHVLEGVQRAMRVALSREIEYLETNLAFLATVGSTSPYIGLFGTVWGIMNSFSHLSNTTQATIASVAPGISEALFTTALGIGVAIPAVWLFNYYTSKVAGFVVEMDNSASELIDYFLKNRTRQLKP